ncbi:cytochrome P450 [Nonomuraea sediminis]|uniref:cytochrome P450 n=1 Tax=Nonomuraea sediminis TaxID=2835864 RepID=UPI001BDC88E2|nr:cytochrome P450 [Nonomuraea sediminis]
MSIKERIFARPPAPGPIHFDERFGAWMVSRHADVRRILSDHGTFSSDELAHSAHPAPHHDNPVLRSLPSLDPPRHHELRRLVARAFTPRAMSALESSIAETARKLLTNGSGEVVDAFASPLTVATLAGLLGISPARRADFVRWTITISEFADAFAEDPVRRARFYEEVAELRTYIREVVADPGGGMIPALATALDESELLDLVTTLIVMGHETTTRLIYHAVLCLERFPAAPAAGLVEEVLRYVPPVSAIERFTITGVNLDGVVLPAGARVVASIRRANRDPLVFADPDTFDATRDPNPHLSFGTGIHVCLGLRLATIQASIAIQALREAFPGRWHVPEDGLEATISPVGVDIQRMRLIT